MVAPEQTLERVSPIARSLGVTRFADITGLDRIGIPVVLSVRPNGGWLAVDAGKGRTKTAATVSAAMECIERQHAEAAELTPFTASYAQLHAAGYVPDVDGMLLARHSLFAAQLPAEFADQWVWTWDIAGDRPLAVPAAAVRAQPVRRRVAGEGLLNTQLSSNGLASGNHVLEALSSALCEVIERDGVACWEQYTRSGGRYRRVDLASIADDGIGELLTAFDAADIDVVLLDCTSDIGVPTFLAYLLDRHQRAQGFFRGYGTHLDPLIAVSRALTEAAQCRCIIVAGSRDDFFWSDMRQARQADNDRRAAGFLELVPTVDLAALPSAATDTFEGDVRVLLDRLAAAGLDRIGVLDLTNPRYELPVLRVFVPGLEGYRTSYYRPGGRALSFRPEDHPTGSSSGSPA